MAAPAGLRRRPGFIRIDTGFDDGDHVGQVPQRRGVVDGQRPHRVEHRPRHAERLRLARIDRQQVGAELRELADKVIARELDSITNPKARQVTESFLQRIRNGERDLRF